VDILFASKNCRELCHDDALATRTIGPLSARKLRTRLDDLAALSNLAHARKLAGRFHALTGDRNGQFALDLQGGCRLVVEPAGNPLPTLQDGSLDLSRVTAIRVVFIGNYHD
jgi:proteic killer suppression protein